MPLDHLSKCPKCGNDRISVQVIAWANYEGGEFVMLDIYETEAIEPLPSPDAVAACEACGHQWNFNGAAKQERRLRTLAARGHSQVEATAEAHRDNGSSLIIGGATEIDAAILGALWERIGVRAGREAANRWFFSLNA